MKKKALLCFLISLCLLSGCAYKSEKIRLYGHEDTSEDGTVFYLKEGWFATGYQIDYEKGIVTITIEKEDE